MNTIEKTLFRRLEQGEKFKKPTICWIAHRATSNPRSHRIQNALEGFLSYWLVANAINYEFPPEIINLKIIIEKEIFKK